MEDVVNHPEHYNSGTPYECIKVLKKWMSEEQYVGFLKGNIIKYRCRSEKKNGTEGLRKARWYMNKLVEVSQ